MPKFEIYDFDETLTRLMITPYILSMNNVKIFRDIVLLKFATHIEKRSKSGVNIIILSYNTKPIIVQSFKLLLPDTTTNKIQIITPDMFGWTSSQVHINRLDVNKNMKRNFIKFLLASDSSMQPSDISFYDDNKDNINAVNTLGVKCILVKTDNDLAHFV